jgi:hypothetical protein
MSTNPHRGEVSLKLGAREVTLRPTFAALVAIERETGMGLIQLVSRIRAGSIAHLPAVIREGASAADQEVTPDEVERAIIAQGAFPIIEAANRFLTSAVTGGSSEKNADTAEATTG